MTTHHDVVCALITCGHKLLIAKRADDAAMPGKWELPGGKTETGETPRAAIVREIREELGCRIDAREVLPSSRHDYPDFTITLTPVVCAVIEGTPQALEHAEIKWAVDAELTHFDWAAADIPVIEEYLNRRRLRPRESNDASGS